MVNNASKTVIPCGHHRGHYGTGAELSLKRWLDGAAGHHNWPHMDVEPLAEDMQIVGTPRLHVEVHGDRRWSALCPARSCNDGTCIHVGHAIMDLGYHAGGDEIQTRRRRFRPSPH